jgi:hypothetical protein
MSKYEVFCFASGNLAVYKDGQQIVKAQEPWILMVAEQLERAGLDPLDALVTLPRGQSARFFRIEGGSLNWEIREADSR